MEPLHVLAERLFLRLQDEGLIPSDTSITCNLQTAFFQEFQDFLEEECVNPYEEEVKRADEAFDQMDTLQKQVDANDEMVLISDDSLEELHKAHDSINTVMRRIENI